MARKARSLPRAVVLAGWLFRTTRCYYFGLKPDGGFVVEDLLPGDHRLQVRVTEPPKDPLNPDFAGFSYTREIGSLTKDIVVPDASADQPEQPFDSVVEPGQAVFSSLPTRLNRPGLG